MTMMLALHFKLGIKTGLLAASISATAVSVPMPPSISLASPETIGIAPHDFAYRAAGDFNQDGRPIDAPLVAIARNASLHIMKRQVTTMEYDRCVSDAKCAPIAPGEATDTDLPVTRASWLDATAYASWLSAKTGETWRLPTDEEWAFAARSRFHDDALAVAGTRDPSARWLARYERETEQAAFDQKPAGSPPGCLKAAVVGNPVPNQFLDRFLKNIKSFALNVPGSGNAIPGQPPIGGFEKASRAVVGGVLQATPPDALGTDFNQDGHGNGFSPPSLLGIFALPPYYHNGACQTLACVLADRNHRTAGNPTDVLADPRKRAKVVTFLESLDDKTRPFE